MDDFILLHPDKEYLEQCLAEIRVLLERQKMQLNDSKTKINKIARPIYHLGFMYRLTKTGKVVVFVDPKKIKHERKKILRMVALVKKGKLTKRDVDRHFKAYKASARYGSSHNLIYRLNRWYESLWEGNNYVHPEKENGHW